MLKKILALLLVQLYFFSVFGVNLHQCLCCVDQLQELSESSDSCQMHADDHSYATSVHDSLCLLCDQSSPSTHIHGWNVESKMDACGCGNDLFSEDCDGTLLVLNPETHDSKKPLHVDYQFNWIQQAFVHPVLISNYFFKITPELANSTPNDFLESSVFRIYTQTALFTAFCTYRT